MASRQPARIYQQIEESADFFEPELYSRLGAFDVTSVLDTESDNFIPLTGATVLPKSETQIMVIGLLPPSVRLTMKLLDRSATIQSLYGSGQEVDVETREFRQGPAGGGSSSVSGTYVTIPGARLPKPDESKGANVPVGYRTSGNSNGPVPILTKLTQEQVYKAMYDAWVRRYNSPPSANQCLLLATQSWRETSGYWYNNNPGMIGNYTEGSKTRPPPANAWSTKYVPAGGDKAFYVSYDSVEAGADAMLAHVMRGNTPQAVQDGDAMGYFTTLAATGYYGDTVGHYYGLSRPIFNEIASSVGKAGGPTWPPIDLPPPPDTCAFKETQGGYQQRVGCKGGFCPEGVAAQRFQTAGDRISDYTGCTVSDAPVGSVTTLWETTGADNAQKAAEDADTRNETELPASTAMTQALEAAQRSTIQALASAIEQMATTPPLRLLVNPESFKVSEEKIIADSNWTRAGPIVEHWGENQPTVSASGKLAAFYALDVNGAGVGSPGNSPGLTRAARNFSLSYQNLMSLYYIYKSNGAIYIPEEFTGNETRKVLAMLGSVYIYYDHILYVGSFSSLNIQESDDKPYTLQYDFEFSVRATWLLDQEADPQRTYGNKEIFSKGLDTIPTSAVTFNPIEGTVSGASVENSTVPLPVTAETPSTDIIAAPVIESSLGPEPEWGKVLPRGKAEPVDPSVSSVIATANDRKKYERTVKGTSIPYFKAK